MTRVGSTIRSDDSVSTMPLRARTGYALGSITTGTYSTVLGLLLMPYLTDALGIAAGIAGLIAFAPKIWEFVVSPIVGRVNDRRGRAHDRRRPLLLRGGILVAIFFALLFIGPRGPGWISALWVLALALACATAYACFQVPFLALSAELSDDYAERTRLMGWRVVVLSVTILISGGTAPLLLKFGEGVSSYRIMGYTMAVFLVLGPIGVWWGSRGVPLARQEHATRRILDQVRTIWRNRDARVLVLAFSIQAVAISMVLGGVIYVSRHIISDPNAASLAFVCFVGPALLFAPLWQRAGIRLGKRRGLVLATIVMGAGFAGLAVSATGDLVPCLIAATVAGAGYAGAQLLPLAMLPDIAAEDSRRTGANRVGMISGIWSGFELLGLALGPALLGVLIDLGGYAETTGGLVSQPETARWMIILGTSIVPAALCALSLLPLAGYRLDARLRLPDEITAGSRVGGRRRRCAQRPSDHPDR